jgi:hypothetical protein
MHEVGEEVASPAVSARRSCRGRVRLVGGRTDGSLQSHLAFQLGDSRRPSRHRNPRFVKFAANRGLRVRRSTADRLVAAARGALPCPESRVARQGVS